MDPFYAAMIPKDVPISPRKRRRTMTNSTLNVYSPSPPKPNSLLSKVKPPAIPSSQKIISKSTPILDHSSPFSDHIRTNPMNPRMPSPLRNSVSCFPGGFDESDNEDGDSVMAETVSSPSLSARRRRFGSDSGMLSVSKVRPFEKCDRAIMTRSEDTQIRFEVANLDLLNQLKPQSENTLATTDCQKEFTSVLYRNIITSELIGSAPFNTTQTTHTHEYASLTPKTRQGRIMTFTNPSSSPTNPPTITSDLVNESPSPVVSSAPRSASMNLSPRCMVTRHQRMLNSRPGSISRVLFPQQSAPLANRPDPHALSPFSTQLIKSTLQLQPREISKSPYKVLDAPDLQDDFYLNLVDWSNTNVLGVGLGSCVYLWNAVTSKVTKLCDLSRGNGAATDSVTSVNWNAKGNYLAIGTNKGVVEVWDVSKEKRIHELTGHDSRVGSIAWNGNLLTTGSRDRSILFRDISRDNTSSSSSSAVAKLTGHRQEVCGLKWNGDLNLLASGGNDNRLLIWDAACRGQPVHTFAEHNAAVKAIAWSPHKSDLLASGGGTADQKIRFWKTSTGTPLSCVNTNSQVCNIAWSRSENEIVSTHGFSQNQVIVWKVREADGNPPSLTQLSTLSGHTMRVLYLAVSPDNQNIVTGAGDETLRFWNVFTKHKNSSKNPGSSYGLGIR